MKTKNTPGPWSVDRYSTGNSRRIVVNGTSGMVADLDWNSHAENDANARLIAAAPELLNMLQRMYDETNGGGTPCLLTLEHAVVAIAKATGGAE